MSEIKVSVTERVPWARIWREARELTLEDHPVARLRVSMAHMQAEVDAFVAALASENAMLRELLNRVGDDLEGDEYD